MINWPINYLSWKCCLLFTSAAYIQMHFKLIMEAITMNPHQTAPKGVGHIVSSPEPKAPR